MSSMFVMDRTPTGLVESIEARGLSAETAEAGGSYDFLPGSEYAPDSDPTGDGGSGMY